MELPRCTTMEEAIKSFEDHGACLVVPEAKLGASPGTSALLAAWCKECDNYMAKHPEWFATSSRHFAGVDMPDESKRYSMNCRANIKDLAWDCLMKEVWKAEGLCVLLGKLMGVLPEDVEVVNCGGDNCKAGCKWSQRLHSDQNDQRKCIMDEDGKWLVASWAVHDIGENQGPLYFVGKQAMNSFPHELPPTGFQHEADWNAVVGGSKVTMETGDVLVRDPRVWHAGTPNTTSEDRYLPGAIFKTREQNDEAKEKDVKTEV
jgi:hypothetical protein